MRIASTSVHHPLHRRRRTLNIPFGAQRFLAAFEGFEGGFAIGASIIVGLSFAGLEQHLLISAALVSIIVNGFNTASVKYSSEHYLDEIDGREKRSPFRHYFMPALIEFIAYFAISFVSILPLLIIDDIQIAILWSCVTTLVILFSAGWWRAFMLHMPRWRDAIETTILGGGIILVGFVSGYILHL
ncbi:MAG: hypothetical protein UY35_C0002G0056 [Candidatus Saccharibacteria bacterium GW2011_GWC2_48_9]|nr:MAG: hypothetical protein UY35_C0002G0056 [Candidatus Saccharibacteria bacterium GW2011_GWC2_48_9]HCH34947.1 hypothetical protein [Candidatus Saccharibacteria bacterium]